MKLYATYKQILAEIQKEDRIKKAYFTSFNLSPEFVERYIIPPIYGEEVPSNELHYENINNVIENTKLDLKFFYDANMLKIDESKRTIAKFYPILLKNGVFHPKVIYIEGEKFVYLFVGSANLTLNGWGRNTEAFRIVKFDKKDNLYNEVYNFFDDVFRLANIKKTTPRKKPTVKSKLNFIYSFDGKSNFIENLQLGKNLQVWSPYFSDLDELVQEISFKSLENINIIPDLIDGQKIRLKQKPVDSRISFYCEDELMENMNKFNHAKVWISDTKIAIGSYNMSKQAINGTNFEASLIEDIEKNHDFKIQGDLIEDIQVEEKVDELINEDSLTETYRYKGLYELVANWKTRSLSILSYGDINENVSIIMPSSVEVPYKDVGELNVNQTTAIFSALVRNKIFTVRDKNDVIFRGLIEEQECKGYRDNLKAENLEDIFDFFIEEKDNKLIENLEERILKKTSLYSYNHQDSFINGFQKNYFTMFKGFKNLKTKLNSIKTNEKKLHSFCFSSVVSLTTIILILEQEKKKQEKNLFLYLCIEEINKIIVLANKLIKSIENFSELKEIKNIELLLTKEDKNFLKACENV